MKPLDPSAYRGREQAFTKHFLLGSYFEYCARVIAQSRYFKRIVFVDGFTGPWGTQTEDFSDTSFGIAIDILSGVKDLIANQGLQVELKCFLIEQDAHAFARLESAVSRFPDVGIEPINEEFSVALPHLKTRPGDFVFLFIDPKGWNINSSVVGQFTRRHRCEVLINFMSSFIHRFVALDTVQDSLDALFARPNWREEVRKDDTGSKFDLYEAFARTCREVYKFQFVAQSEVLKPGRNEDHYVMFFGTNHERGLSGFRESQLKSIEAQISSWSAVRDKDAPKNLFDWAEKPLPHIPWALSDPRYENQRMVSYILEQMKERQVVTTRTLWIECAEAFIVKRSQFNFAISDQIQRGKLYSPAVKGRRKVPHDADPIYWIEDL